VVYYSTLNGTTISDEIVGVNGQDVTLSIPKAGLGQDNNVVIMARIGGCSGLPLTNVASIQIKDIPTVSEVNGASNCGEGSLMLNASGAPTDGSYRWYLTEDATDAIADQDGSTYTTPSLTKTKTYFVSAVNSLGCEGGRMAVTATISYPYEIVGVTGSQSCEGGSFSLSAAGAPSDGTYKWYLSQSSAESIPGETAATFETPSLTASTTYYVSILNATGCEGARMPVTAEIINVAPAITADGNVLSSNVATGNQWYLNGTAIPGATSQTYQATQSGLYKLIVTVGTCSKQVEKEFAVTGDIADDGVKGYDVYPNATAGLIYVEVATIDAVSVSVKNQLGTEITRNDLKQSGDTRKGQLDISGHASGVYLVVISHGERTVIRKIVKN